MNILVLNSGSSSIKFQVVQTDSALIARDGDRCLAKGQIERVGRIHRELARVARIEVKPRKGEE